MRLRNRSWFESGWAALVCVLATVLPWLGVWYLGPKGHPELATWGFLPVIWIPLALVTSFGFGLGHAILRNAPDVLACRRWHPRESILHGVGHGIVVLVIGFVIAREGITPLYASFVGGMITFAIGEASSISKDFMLGNF